LNTTNNCIFIRGNHDELVLHWLKDNKDNPLWHKHGGEATVKVMKVDDSTKQLHTILLSLDDYYLDKKNRLFVHAGFTNMNGVAYEFFSKTILLGQNPLGNCLVTRPKHQTQ
jgi:serine/threonine protein phosphatase 1